MNDEPKVCRSLPVHERDDHKRPLPSSLHLDGLVARCLDLTLGDLELLPQKELRDDFKCREGWVLPDVNWRGVLLQTVLALAKPHREARHVQASTRDFSISLPLDRAADALLAISLNGTNLSVEHGSSEMTIVGRIADLQNPFTFCHVL